MRVLPILLFMTAIATGTAAAQDPVVVDPDHYKVVFENEQVRVLRISYGPQEASVMHEHPAGVAVYLTDLRGQFTMPDGESVEMGGNAGEAVWTEAGSHLPKNLTDEPFELILVELKAPPSAED